MISKRLPQGGACLLNNELWDGSRLLLPVSLVDAYSDVITASGLYAKTQENRPDPSPVGGPTQEQSDEHFAHSFDGSAARVQLVQLNPRGEMPTAAASLGRLLSGGDLCLVDLPSGAGAGALTLLTVLAHLRLTNILPRQPLNVRLMWGEISDPARAYSLEMLQRIDLQLRAQGIQVTVDAFHWDVLSDLSNQNLLEKIAQTRLHFPQTLLFVSSFSGFLHRAGKLKEAETNLHAIFKFCSGDLNAMVWIEPATNGVISEFVQSIVKFVAKIPLFARFANPTEPSEISRANFMSPLVQGLVPRVNAVAMRMDLNRDKHE